MINADLTEKSERKKKKTGEDRETFILDVVLRVERRAVSNNFLGWLDAFLDFFTTRLVLQHEPPRLVVENYDDRGYRGATVIDEGTVIIRSSRPSRCFMMKQ